jgi:hypothetical protein
VGTETFVATAPPPRHHGATVTKKELVLVNYSINVFVDIDLYFSYNSSAPANLQNLVFMLSRSVSVSLKESL